MKCQCNVQVKVKLTVLIDSSLVYKTSGYDQQLQCAEMVGSFHEDNEEIGKSATWLLIIFVKNFGWKNLRIF